MNSLPPYHSCMLIHCQTRFKYAHFLLPWIHGTRMSPSGFCWSWGWWRWHCNN